MNEIFRKFAQVASDLVGSSWAFLLAVGLLVGWIISGPIFHYSNTWQLFINTITTIVTFLIVFLIQNAQNREAKATQLKLDELIRASYSRDKLIDAEDMSDEELEREKEKIISSQIERKKKQKKSKGSKKR